MRFLSVVKFTVPRAHGSGGYFPSSGAGAACGADTDERVAWGAGSVLVDSRERPVRQMISMNTKNMINGPNISNSSTRSRRLNAPLLMSFISSIMDAMIEAALRLGYQGVGL